MHGEEVECSMTDFGSLILHEGVMGFKLSGLVSVSSRKFTSDVCRFGEQKVRFGEHSGIPLLQDFLLHLCLV